MGDQRIWELCRDGDIEGVQAAIDNGAYVNEENDSDGTGLMWALGTSHNNVVQLLLNHPQIDINRVDYNGWNALHYALFEDNHEGMEALLARQDLTTINQMNDEGRTPIMLAIYQDAESCFNLLLNHPQIDINKEDLFGLCALHYAVANHEITAALLARQDLTTINQRCRYQGRTPIMEAVRSNAVNCFKLLLAHPELDLDIRDIHDMSPEGVCRFVENHKEQTFEVINELLEDKTLMISKLAGLGPVWDGEVEKGVNGVKKELINYWEEEARKGRTIEEYARDEDHPELADLVVNERKRRAAGIAD